MIEVRVIGESVIETPRGHVTPTAEVFFSLLLVLAVERGRRVTRERLLELFWAGEPDAQARHNLRQLIYKATKRYGIPLATEAGAVTWAADAVQLDIEDGVDTVEWARMTLPGAPLGVLLGVPAAGTDALRVWLDRLRARGESIVRERLLRGISTAREASDWEAVERLSRHCLTLDPLNEEATLTLAESMALSGSKAKAVRLLSDYEEEVGGGESALALPARVLRRRIRKTEHKSYGELRGALIGRDAEIGTLVRRMRQAACGESSQLTLIGPHGSGKSRILEEVGNIARIEGFQTFALSSHSTHAGTPASGLVALVPLLLSGNGALGASPETITTLRSLISSPQSINPSPSASSDILADSLVDLLRALCFETPIAIVLDDAHRIDEYSLGLLRASVSALKKEPLLLVTSSIRDYPISVSQARQILRLAPLSLTAGRLLATRTLEAHGQQCDDTSLAALVNTSARQPLDILAACDSFLDGTSSPSGSGLSAHLGRRLDQLCADDRRLFITIVLLSGDCDLSLLEQIAALSPLQLEDRLLRLVSGGYVSLQMNGMVDVSETWRMHLTAITSQEELALRRHALATQLTTLTRNRHRANTHNAQVAANLLSAIGDHHAAAQQRLAVAETLIARGLGWACADLLAASRPQLTPQTVTIWKSHLRRAVLSSVESRSPHETTSLLALAELPGVEWDTEDIHAFRLCRIQTSLSTRSANAGTLHLVDGLLAEGSLSAAHRFRALIAGTKAADHINDQATVVRYGHLLASCSAPTEEAAFELRTAQLIVLLASKRVADAVECADELAKDLRRQNELARSPSSTLNCRIPHIFDSNHARVGDYVLEALESEGRGEYTGMTNLLVVDIAATFFVDSLDLKRAADTLDRCYSLANLYAPIGFRNVLDEVRQRLSVASHQELQYPPPSSLFENDERRFERHRMFSLCHYAVDASRRGDTTLLRKLSDDLELHWRRMIIGSPLDIVPITLAICDLSLHGRRAATTRLATYYRELRVARHGPTPFLQGLLAEFKLPTPSKNPQKN